MKQGRMVNRYEFLVRIFTNCYLYFIVILGKAQRVVDDVNEKVRSLDGLFHIIDTATDKVVLVTDKVIDVIMGFIAKIFVKDEEEKRITTKKKEGKRK